MYSLGIDTGGTFTDAVLVDHRGDVVAAAKSLTTHYDLTEGIGAVLRELPADMMRLIHLVALSTTLTTNSVVEGRGAPVCVLLAGYDELQVRASGLIDLLGPESVVTIRGSHDAGAVLLPGEDPAQKRRWRPGSGALLEALAAHRHRSRATPS